MYHSFVQALINELNCLPVVDKAFATIASLKLNIPPYLVIAQAVILQHVHEILTSHFHCHRYAY